MKATFRYPLLVILLAIGLYSCKSDSDSGTNPIVNTTTVQAKAGSSYTFDSTSSSSNTTGSLTYNIVQDDLTIGGRTGVRVVTQGLDTAFRFVYNTDGSMSMFFANDPEMALEYGDGVWLRMPTKGGAGQSLTVIDTTFIDPESGFPISIKLKFETSYIGTTTFALNGKSYAAQKVKLVTDQNFFFPSVSETIFTWVPEIGFYAKEESTTSAIGESETDSEVLTSFNLVK
jgi:hypothetical protein